MIKQSFDRYVVSTYGRSGSVLVTNFIKTYLDMKFGSSTSVFNKLDGWYDVHPIPPETVYHCHSLRQLDLLPEIPTCGVVFTVREPSICAVSMILRKRLNVAHVHNPKWIDLLNMQKQDLELSASSQKGIQYILDEHRQWNDSYDTKFHVDVKEFQKARNDVCYYNSTAIKKLKIINDRVSYLNYSDWQGDLVKLAALLNVTPFEIYMYNLKNTRHWSQNVSNADEIQKCLDDFAHEDQDLLLNWKNQLFDNNERDSYASI